jgi:hypothetical protein
MISFVNREKKKAEKRAKEKGKAKTQRKGAKTLRGKERRAKE